MNGVASCDGRIIIGIEIIFIGLLVSMPCKMKQDIKLGITNIQVLK